MVLDFVDLPAKDPGRELKFSEKMSCPNDHTDRHRRARAPLVLLQLARSAPAPSATASAPGWRSTPSWSCPTPQATLGEGAIQPWSQAHVADYFLRLMGALGEELGFDLNTPWDKLSAKARKSLLDGHPTKVHVVTTNRYGRQRAYYAEFEGVRSYIERRHARGRVRHQPRALRGLHARGAVPGLPGQPAQAGQPAR